MNNQRAPLIIIPARLEATRLPDKPLADIGGIPMVVRVMQQALKAGIGPVVVAAGHPRIKEVVEHYGGQAVLTDPTLPSGTDRVFAAVKALAGENGERFIINLQGDIPFVDPAFLNAALECLITCKTDIATLAALKDDAGDFHNPNVVKIAASSLNNFYRAHYFSRAPIPPGEGPFFHHLGIYAFTQQALKTFVHLPLSPLEKRERLEQLRAIENGMTISFAAVDGDVLSVDTPEDLEEARRMVL
jgi:3-deoxy-manno-octulosonate cytidylyltransferase (CMP-KDO synthetase)